MKKINFQKHKHLLFGFACGIAIVALYVAGSANFGTRTGSPTASAAIPALTTPAVDAHVRGWAWSSTVGWISFDCRDMGVCGTSNYSSPLDITTGKVSGYAWASTIGWIKMDPTGPYPEAPAHGLQVDMNTGVLSGWIRATANGGGWDGWIKIHDAKVVRGGYIKNGAETDGGWMWGSDVVGWVKMWMGGNVGTYFPAVDCAFGIDPVTEIIPPQSVTLAWRCNQLTRANSCSIDNSVGTNLPISGNRTARPTEPTTYTLTCQGFGGPVEKTVDVSVAGKVRIIEVQ